MTELEQFIKDLQDLRVGDTYECKAYADEPLVRAGREYYPTIPLELYKYQVRYQGQDYERLLLATAPDANWDRAKVLKEEFKMFEGRRYHGFDDDKKSGSYNGLGYQSWNWSAPLTHRNLMRLADLCGYDIYEQWDGDLIALSDLEPRISKDNGWPFDPYQHQIDMAIHAATYRHCIFAAECGTGKTLAMILTLEYLNRQYNFQKEDIWYVGPKSAVKSVALELDKWKSGLDMMAMTYEGMVNMVENWEGGKAPRAIIYDECQKIKTPSAIRSKMAKHLANAVRAEYGYESLILGMTGTPSPNKASDWWHQCETVAPAFVREGSMEKFRDNLRLVEFKDNLNQGGKYADHVTWWDDENKCGTCGTHKNDHSRKKHEWTPSENKVEALTGRLEGLVIIKLKKDCLDLPEVQYIVKRLKPSKEQFSLYRLIQEREQAAIQQLSSFRTISDGFTYAIEDHETETEGCPVCHGTGKYNNRKLIKGDLERPETCEWEDDINTCTKCSGGGVVAKQVRVIKDVETPKDNALTDLLEQHEDIGRFVVWAGFQATIDKLQEFCRREEWFVLKIDGRSWAAVNPDGDPVDTDELLKAMDASHPDFKYYKEKYPRVCVVAHPEAGGTGLTFTAAPACVYYSNTFKGEDRVQSEQRIHRAGMDLNRGCTIYDLVCLPSDVVVYESLRNKRKLEKMTLGVLREEIEKSSFNNEETVK
jgi:SNF2 family DNA or RNA helicase